MAKHRLTIEVDGSMLFDTLHEMKGDTSLVGDRLVGAMMTGEHHWRDDIGLGIYGIVITAIEPIKSEAEGKHGGE